LGIARNDLGLNGAWSSLFKPMPELQLRLRDVNGHLQCVHCDYLTQKVQALVLDLNKRRRCLRSPVYLVLRQQLWRPSGTFLYQPKAFAWDSENGASRGAMG
jgi:hypothetical protein